MKTRPDVVAGIHKLYLEAGADIIETNTFNGTHLVLSDFHVGDEAYALNKAAAELARKAAADYSTPYKPRWVAGSMGPTTRAISVTGGVTFDELRQNYYDQARALVDGGVDVLLLETCNDTRSVKAGLLGIERLRQELGVRIPIMLSATIEPMGSMLAGQGADAFWTSVSHADLISVGLNCGTGPEFMTDHLRTLHELATTRISCYPNAGLPNEELKYNETPESVAGHLERFVNNGWLNIVGGCCGTTPAHIKAIAEMVEGKRPRPVKASAHRVFFSGKELVEAEESNRPLIVGERTNVIGSRLRREVGRSNRNRALAGQERRAHCRRLPAEHRPR